MDIWLLCQKDMNSGPHNMDRSISYTHKPVYHPGMTHVCPATSVILTQVILDHYLLIGSWGPQLLVAYIMFATQVGPHSLLIHELVDISVNFKQRLMQMEVRWLFDDIFRCL